MIYIFPASSRYLCFWLEVFDTFVLSLNFYDAFNTYGFCAIIHLHGRILFDEKYPHYS